MRLSLTLLLLLLAGPAGALDLDPGPGAELVLDEAAGPDALRLATGPWAGGALPLEVAEGELRRRVWHLPSAGTTLQILAPLRAQVAAAGLELRLDCDTEGCGGFDFRQGVEVVPPPAMFVDLGDFRYLSARGPGEGGEAVSLLVSRGAGRGFVQAITVTGTQAPVAAAGGTEAPLPDVPGPPSVPLVAGLEAELLARGHVVLDGLAFATGSAELAPGEEGAAVLEALAEVLARRPGLRVAIVGHTDATGAAAANLALSGRRAAMVVDRLAALGVARGRLEAGGLGYLAPVASNLTPEGREANRRVEAVILEEAGPGEGAEEGAGPGR